MPAARLLAILILVLASCDERAKQAEAAPPQAPPREDSPAQVPPPEAAPPPVPPPASPQDRGPSPGKIEQLAFSSHAGGLPAKGHFAGVAMADLDGDGKAELLSGRREEAQGLFLFRFVDGKWSQRQLTDSGDYGGVRLADLTGDGIPDVLAVKTGGRPKGLELFETRRDDTGLSFVPLPSPYLEGCDDLDVADLDNDGDLDLVVSSRGDRVFLNGGKGRSFEKIELNTDVYEDTGIVLTDVNADGLIDILSTNHPGQNTRLFLCESRQPLRFSARHTAGLPLDDDIGFKIAAGDINGDGHIDLAIGTRSGLRLFHGTSCKGPEADWWPEVRFGGRSSQTIQPVLADLDRDGDADLVYTSEEGLQIRLNDGHGKFGERLLSPAIPGKGSFSGCCVDDWDGDGDLDIAFSSFQGGGLSLILNTN